MMERVKMWSRLLKEVKIKVDSEKFHLEIDDGKKVHSTEIDGEKSQENDVKTIPHRYVDNINETNICNSSGATGLVDNIRQEEVEEKTKKTELLKKVKICVDDDNIQIMNRCLEVQLF